MQPVVVIAILVGIFLLMRGKNAEPVLSSKLLEEALVFKEKIRPFENYVETSARNYKVAPNLIRAVIWKESSGRATVIGDDGRSFGLMQVSFVAAEDVGFYNLDKDLLLRPDTNITVGTAYLGYLYYNFGNWVDALSAYNWGMGKVQSARDRGQSYPAVVRDYVGKVLLYQRALQQTS